jgi:hypothetical protein
MIEEKCIIGGIIKGIQEGYSFKINFKNKETAQKYKDILYWIIKNDNIPTDVSYGYFDDKQKYDYEGNEK